MKLNPAVIEYYRSNPITTIDLEAESQDTASIRAFASVLEDHHYISTLMFSESSISDEQVQILAAAIAKNRSLRFIDFSSNPITGKGIEYLAQALQDNHFIRAVNLSYIELSPSSIELLNRVIYKSQSITRVIPESITSLYAKRVLYDNQQWQKVARLSILTELTDPAKAVDVLREIHNIALTRDPSLAEEEQHHTETHSPTSGTFS